MSVLKKCLLLVVAAGMVFVILVPGAPSGQATLGTAPASASRFAHEIRNKGILKGVMR